MYRQVSSSSHIRFVEIYNTSNSTIDLTGYQIAGDINYSIPDGSTIAPQSFIVIAANADELNSAYTIDPSTSVLGNWSGTLALDSGSIQLLDSGMNIIDELQYEGWGTWPNSSLSNGQSIQKINPNLSSNNGGAWDKGTPTPGANNQAVLVDVFATIPIIQTITHQPHQPKANEEVFVFVKLSQLTSSTNLILEYQLVDPGNYIRKEDDAYNTDWTALSMNDNGIEGDEIANDSIYSILMPSSLQQDRRLVRYRITVNSNNDSNYNKLFPDQSFNESNFSYFVYDTHVAVNGYDINQLDKLQTFFFISNGINSLNANYSGTVVTDKEVFDHVLFRKKHYYSNPRRNYRVDFNDGRPVSVEDDYGNPYSIKRDRLNLSGTDMCDKSSHGLTESLILKMFELNNSVASYADYTHLRFIDNADPDTDFQGLHVLRDYTRNNKDIGTDFLKERNLPDGNIYGYKNPFAMLYNGELPPYTHLNTEYNEWNAGWDDFSDGCSSCDVPIPALSFLEEKIDLDNHYGFMIAQEYIANNETNYGGQHNYYEYYNPITQKLLVIPDDFNASFGTPRDEDGFALRSEFDPTEDIRGPFKQAIIHHESLRVEFENHIRSGLDLLLNAEQSAFLVDNEVKKIYDATNSFNWTDVDQSKWNQDYTDYEEVIQDYKDFFTQRANHLHTLYGSSKMPNKPVITYTGPSDFPNDGLTFTNSDFVDPQGNTTFTSLEWRIGEWSDPDNSIYQSIPKDIYEITPVWHSGDIITFSNTYNIQNANLISGRTYRVRVRYKDNTGRKSYWSDPIEFVQPYSECSQVNDSADDAEENISDGTMNLTSGDLDMVNDNGEISIVGLRFQNITIPQGAFIKNANIQFTADEANAEITALVIRGEAIGDALAFTMSNGNISTRTKTDTSITWSPKLWAKDANTPDQQSINIAPIIREIVNRPDFVAGNSIAIIIEGTGIRTAESYDGAPDFAPELCFDYILEACTIGDSCDDGNPNTNNDSFDANCNCIGINPLVKAKILLEGYYDSVNQQMNTALKEKSLLPLNQPFNVAPWYYTGAETATVLPNAAVDWVLVMSRDTNGTILNQGVGFVNQTGELINIDESIGIPLADATNNYISVHPRAHLAIISSNPYTGDVYDFTTDSNSAAGTNQIKLVSGKYMLHVGDYDGNGIINSLDFNNWKIQSAALNQYLSIDGDGNGIINNVDFNLWQLNKSKVGEPSVRY